MITNGDGAREEVRGDGVVGQQPLLSPGESHHYTSGCVLETPIGSMQGSYRFLAEDGELFDAAIGVFTLSFPGSLH